ncbi:MAG: adenylosuccinate lyase, partial [Planctomycetaceae bacterium]
MDPRPAADPHERWDNPLAARYASAAMAGLWSDNHRYRLWRQAWLALADAEAEHGLPITNTQLYAMRAAREPNNIAK